MSLLAHLGLPAPPASSAPPGAPAPATEPGPAGGTPGGLPGGTPGRSAGGRTRAPGGPKGRVEPGEPQVDAQTALGALEWGGRVRGSLWAMMPPDVPSGGGAPATQMAEMNAYGQRALSAIRDVNALEKQWRDASAAVLAAHKRGQGELKQLKAAEPAMRKRMKSGGDFFQDVNGFLEAREKAELIVGEIALAEKQLDAAMLDLERSMLGEAVKKAMATQKAAQAELDALQAELEQVKSIFSKVVDIGKQVAKGEWKSLAEQAAMFLVDQAIEASYAPQLNELSKAVEAAKSEVDRLGNEILKKQIEGDRARVAAASIALENAQSRLKTALNSLRRFQANAINELGEDGSTKIAGRMLEERATQRQAVGQALALCQRYLAVSPVVAKRVGTIGDQYGQVGAWLERAAKADAAFAPSLYTRQLELWARQNVVRLDDWRNWVDHAAGDCRKALGWLRQPGDKGPHGPFEAAVAQIDHSLGG